MESIIMKDKHYHLSGKKQLLRLDSGIEVVIVDVSEYCIERTKITIQLRRNGIPQNTIGCRWEYEKDYLYYYSKGRKHDYKLFKESKTHIHPSIKAQVDTGSQGLKKLHPNTEMPKREAREIH